MSVAAGVARGIGIDLAPDFRIQRALPVQNVAINVFPGFEGRVGQYRDAVEGVIEQDFLETHADDGADLPHDALGVGNEAAEIDEDDAIRVLLFQFQRFQRRLLPLLQ